MFYILDLLLLNESMTISQHIKYIALEKTVKGKMLIIHSTFLEYQRPTFLFMSNS